MGSFINWCTVTHRGQPYTPGMQNAEIELKFPVASLRHLEQSLHALGFLIETPRTFESNTLYDTPERTLRERGELLRVRTYGTRNVVTHKRHPDQEDPASIYKVRIETESEVTDGEALAEIFTRLGYAPAFRYEKFRTEYSDPHSDGHAVVDETPIGIYAELEGPTNWIDRTLAGLGVDPGHLHHRQLRSAVPHLERAHRQRRREPYLRRNRGSRACTVKQIRRRFLHQGATKKHTKRPLRTPSQEPLSCQT